MQLLAAVIIILLVYFIQWSIYSRKWSDGLSVGVSFTKEYVECGDRAELVETIENDKSLPLPVFHIKTAVDRNLKFEDMENSVVTDYYHRNDIYSLMGHQRVERHLIFQTTHRGIYHVENLNVLVRDFFLVSTFAAIMKSEARIMVFPEKMDISSLEPYFRGVLGEIPARRSIVEDSLTYRGIRDYQPFDGYRSINWKQSAKSMNGLKVNVYDYTMDAEVRILVNLDTENMIETDRILETSISIASSAARRFLRSHVKTSVYTNGTASKKDSSKVLSNPGGGSEIAHGIAIDKYLAQIDGSAGTEAFLKQLDKEKKDCGERVLYMVISPYHKTDFIQKLDQLEKAGMSLLLVVPYFDKVGYKPSRPYMYGWELALEDNE